MNRSKAAGSRRGGVVTACVIAVGLIAATVAFLVRGDDGRGSLASACGGRLYDTDLEELLGATDLQLSEPSTDASCAVKDPGQGKASLTVEVRRTDVATKLLGRLHRQNAHTGGEMVTPIGNGWAGVLNTSSPDHAYAAAYVACKGGPDAGLVVTVDAYRDPSARPLDEGGQRARLARLTTETLRNAASGTACEGARLGTEVSDVPADTTRTLKAEGEAAGSCEGIAHAAYESAADKDAPLVDCLVADDTGNKRFRLSAYYGPFVKSARLETLRARQATDDQGGRGGFHWATASCPSGEALFTIETLEIGDGAFTPPDDRAETEALRTFAQRSAGLHGCLAPQLP
ncbi:MULTISPECIES: hypothetical protein [Streptomyces]|uniref:hypothetical protein n=1 Tax=Streptomyces TaxID=1883 RepID=UPI002F3F24ED